MTITEMKQELHKFFKDRNIPENSEILKQLKSFGFLENHYGKSYAYWGEHNFYPEAHKNPYQKEYDKYVDNWIEKNPRGNMPPDNDITTKYYEWENNYYESEYAKLENRRYIIKITDKKTNDYIYCGWDGIKELRDDNKWYWGLDIINHGLKNEEDSKKVYEICKNVFKNEDHDIEIINCDGIHAIDYD